MARGPAKDLTSDQEVNVARQNPILRAHFQKQFDRTFDSFDRGADDPFVERYIDGQIDHYLKNLRVRLLRMRVGYISTKEALDGKSGELPQRLPRTLHRRLKDSLKQLADAANGLRSMIERILSGGLDRNGQVKPRVGRGSRETAFARELRFLKGEMESAEQRINDYFLNPTFTVDVEELRNQNMLVHLYRVREMANRLRKAL